MLGHQTGFQHKYLRIADLRRLEQMLFAPRRTVEGRFSGQYRTRQRGQSVEFRDYREYLPGDEIGAIDWKVYGRSDKLVVKLFEHQSELTLQLLVDGSASMAYRGQYTRGTKYGPSKYDYACQLAAAIGFLVIKQHDRVGFAVAQGGLHRRTPAETSMRHLAGILKSMEAVRPQGVSSLADSIDELSRSGRRRSLLVVFSDLLDDPDAIAAKLAARVNSGGEAILFHTLHPDEVTLPDVEHGTFVDSESGQQVRLDVSEIRDEYADRMREFLDRWSARCRSLGIDYIRADTGEPYYEVLERYLIGRSALTRGR